MAVEYKLVGLNMELLNDLGQQFWNAVGTVVEEGSSKVLLARDTDLPIVSDGLYDHPTDTVLMNVALIPTEPLSLSKMACIQHLNQHFGNSAKPTDYGATTEYTHDGIREEYVKLRQSGRIDFGWVRRIEQPAEILPHQYLARKILQQLRVLAVLFCDIAAGSQFRAILTLGGIKGCRLDYANRHDWAPVHTPFVQVAAEAGLPDLFEENTSRLARDLFGQIYWNLGIAHNMAFKDDGALR